MSENKISNIEKMTEYLKLYDELSNFIISRKVFKTLIWWVSIYSILFTLFAIFGAKTYINNTVKDNIDTQISKTINEEISYLRKRNEVTYMSDQIFINGDVAIYEDLKQIESDISENLKIRLAAKSKILRIELFFFSEVSDEVYLSKDIEFKDKSGKIIRGSKILTNDLIKIYNSSSDLGKQTTILSLLTYRKDKIIPKFLYKVAKETNNLRIRYVAINVLSQYLMDFPKNKFDYEYFKDKV